MLSQNYHYRWNAALFASQGYIYVSANRRGVPGFGQAWCDAISKDWGGKPMEDYLAVTDQFVKEPYVKTDGIAAIGASAGGYAAYWLAGHHQGRYKAFVAHCGVFDIVSKYGSTEELFFPNWEFGGPYWIPENRANMEKNAPINYVQNWDTPILISTGERDFRVPYTQSLEAFTAAQQRGIPSELIIFPNETHFIAHAQEYMVWFSEVNKFLDKYCKK
jgi:dipeptidyl aminopeptidase/acylaminoacyl peptidase